MHIISIIDYITIYIWVKKKWSDLKLATKKHVAALRHSTRLTGGGQIDPGLALIQREEQVAALIESASVSGGRDTGHFYTGQ